MLRETLEIWKGLRASIATYAACMPRCLFDAKYLPRTRCFSGWCTGDMVCLTTVALGLLAVPTIVWLVTYFGERRLLVLDCVFFGDAICLPLFGLWAPVTSPRP